jgi:hypothetical protein
MSCQWCGCGPHIGKCPEVKSLEYNADGTIKRIEFFSWADKCPPMSVPAAPMPMQPWVVWNGGAQSKGGGQFDNY